MQGFPKATDAPIQPLLEVNDRILAPDMLLQCLPHKEFPRPSDEHREYPGRLWLKANRRRALPQFACFAVKLKIAESEFHAFSAYRYVVRWRHVKDLTANW